jgi:hypothetical protein
MSKWEKNRLGLLDIGWLAVFRSGSRPTSYSWTWEGRATEYHGLNYRTLAMARRAAEMHMRKILKQALKLLTRP